MRVSWTHPQPGGFKTYTESLISSLSRVDLDNEYFLYMDRPYGNLIDLLNNPNFHGRVVSGDIPFVGVPWREQLKLASYAKKDHVDLFHSPCLTAPLNLNCPLVVTVHDMIWAFPEKYSRGGSMSFKRRLMEGYNRMIPAYSSRRADAIITVSHAARESILEYLKLKDYRLFVTHEAPNPLFKQVKDQQHIQTVQRKYELPLKFVMAIGSADPRKNITRLVQAYSQLPKELRDEFHLVIVWTHSFLADELSEQIKVLQLTSYVHFLRSVSNNDLVVLYSLASLFAFPSLYEGFGLPPLEAMACGAPVIAADNSSIPEIVGDAALLFKADDIDEIYGVMKRVLMDDPLRLTMGKKGMERAATFSWDKCARETLDVYSAVYRNRN